MKDAPLRHRLEYAAYRAARLPLRLLPHAAARRVGRGLGELGWAVDRRHRRITLDNLALALPELPAAERRRVARACFHHFGAALTDTLSATRFDLVELCRRTTIEGWHHVQAAQAAAAPRGFFVATAHFGLWEVAAHALGVYAGTTWVVGRPLDNPHLDHELARVRSRFGNRLLPKRGALRGMLLGIEAGDVVALLIDQRVQPREAIDVPFFGVPAWTTPILARLSLRLQVPVVPGFAYPAPGGRYRLVFHPPVWPPVWPPAKEEAAAQDGAAQGAAQDGTAENGDGAVAALTLRYHQVMEEAIRRDPELWLWLHRRWKR